MTTKAQHVLEEIRTLPPPDLQLVWREVNNLLGTLATPPHLNPAPRPSPAEMMAALDRLTGCTRGSHSRERLLEERRRDREQEEAQLQHYLAHRRGANDV